MGIRDDVLAAREALASHLDYAALELLDLEIEDEDWETALAMARNVSEVRGIPLPEKVTAQPCTPNHSARNGFDCGSVS